MYSFVLAFCIHFSYCDACVHLYLYLILIPIGCVCLFIVVLMHSFCCCCTLRDVDVYRPCWVKFGCPTRNDFLESRACGIHREHEEFGAFDSGGELKLRPSNLRHSDSGSCCNLLVPKLHDLQADAVE